MTTFDQVNLPYEGTVPSLDGATEWLNSPQLTPASLRGRVALFDFCTYTCINWLRTLPYIRAWSEKYKEQGLVVIGVHTPEFGFEHDLANVRPALERRGIDYPVAIDNDYAVWGAFDNNYWPALYLVDTEGSIRYHHFGEGRYEDSELAIQQLIAETGALVEGSLVSVDPKGDEVQAAWEDLKSPETYLGYERTESFASPGGASLGRARSYELPAQLKRNQWGLSGEWTVIRDAIVSNEPGARLAHRFHARDVNLVMGPRSEGTIAFRVTIDGREPGASHGADVDEHGTGILREPRMYQLVRQAGDVAERTFEVTFADRGMSGYSFTFG
jgi:Thioredoxin like C-terminal domain/AhpC/TSA family